MTGRKKAQNAQKEMEMLAFRNALQTGYFVIFAAFCGQSYWGILGSSVRSLGQAGGCPSRVNGLLLSAQSVKSRSFDSLYSPLRAAIWQSVLVPSAGSALCCAQPISAALRFRWSAVDNSSVGSLWRWQRRPPVSVKPPAQGLGQAGEWKRDCASSIRRLDLGDMTLTAVLTQDSDGGYVAYNPETGTTTQGDSVPEALSNLREATELYLEEFPLEMSSPALMTTFQVAHA